VSELVKEFHERNPMAIRTMVLKEGGQDDKGIAMPSSPFHLNTLASDNSFPSLLTVIDGTDPMLQGPQLWYDETSPYMISSLAQTVARMIWTDSYATPLYFVSRSYLLTHAH
jgi:hypothetical protein